MDGRPGNGLGRNGPDIVAYDRRQNRLIVVESKGTLAGDKPLTLEKLQSSVGGRVHVQPSRPWLRAQRSGSNDYLRLMKESGKRDYEFAARLIDELNAGRRSFDAKVVHVRQDLAGVKAYGPGVDTSARIIREGGNVDDLDIIDVPYPNR